MESKRVRVSIANLAWYVRIKQNDVRYPFAILNPNKLKKGECQYMALGGGAMLTESGKKALEESFDASDFELDKHTGLFDARFQIYEKDLEAMFGLFSNINGIMKTYEQDRTLDIMAELSGKEFPGYERILDDDEVKLVKANFVKVVRQKPSEAAVDTSARGASAEVPTRRLFRIYELVMPKELYQRKLLHSPVVKILSDDELKTTDGGCKAGLTSDGLVIQNNLFLA